MVSGTLRGVLWVLGGLRAVWVLLWLLALPSMQGMMNGGMPGGGMGGGMDGGRGMIPMMGIMSLQVVGMLGLAGIFVYLVVDTLRGRSSRPGTGPDGERPGRE